MFLAKGMFLRRTFIDEQLSANLPSTCQKLASLKNMTGQIALCQPCCETLLRGKESSDHFLGYLTKKENTEYRKYARNAEKLHSDGYLVVDRRDFGGCNFPLDQFPQVCNSSKGNIETLPNGGFDRTNKRSWMLFKANWGSAQNAELQKLHRKKLADQMTKIISPDIFFGRRAMENRFKLLKAAKFKLNDNYQNWQAFAIKGEAALWRALGLGNYQSPHADAHAGSFNMIEALTNHYAIKVWRWSHFLPFWDRNNRPTVHGSGKVVTINSGQILVFHSNLIHCGGMSCQKDNNFTKVRDSLIRMDKVNTEKINWFGSGTSSVKECVITDMSLHYTVDALSGQMSEGDFSAGKIEIFLPIWESNADEYYSKALKKGLKEYEDMKMPWRADAGKPCGSTILDVDKVLGLYLKGDSCTPSKRKSGRISRRL